MRMNGTSGELDMNVDEVSVEAVVTDDRIAVDWIYVNDKRVVLEACSDDGGQTYKGTFGYPRPEPDGRMDLTRYSGPGESVLLYGEWVSVSDGHKGVSIIRLVPER